MRVVVPAADLLGFAEPLFFDLAAVLGSRSRWHTGPPSFAAPRWQVVKPGLCRHRKTCGGREPNRRLPEPDWLKCNVLDLEFFDGVPRFVVPDNLKSAVTKNTSDVVILNRVYAELSEHYGFQIYPARPRKPKDKSLGEIAVQLVQRFVLARLRASTFFSLDELNEKISYWVDELNSRITRTYPKEPNQPLP